MTKTERGRLIEQGVIFAQRVGREEGFKIGQEVASPKDPMTYLFVGADGITAQVVIPAKLSRTKKTVRKEFPMSELFDPTLADKHAIELLAKKMLKGRPILN